MNLSIFRKNVHLRHLDIMSYYGIRTIKAKKKRKKRCISYLYKCNTYIYKIWEALVKFYE